MAKTSIPKNSPELWDSVWEGADLDSEEAFSLAKEEKTIRWQRIEAHVLTSFKSFKGLKVIEIGAGAGTNSALMAARGANVTILDYSKKALDQSKKLFKKYGLKATFIEQNALKLSKKLLGTFDISLSFGFAEHFLDQERKDIVTAHFAVLKKKGITFVVVPNAYNPPYRLFKLLTQRTRFWKVGEEYPFGRRELRRIGESDKTMKDISFFGDSFFASFNFFNPFIVYSRLTGKKRQNKSPDNIRKERGTFLDAYVSYSIILFAKKK